MSKRNAQLQAMAATLPELGPDELHAVSELLNRIRLSRQMNDAIAEQSPTALIDDFIARRRARGFSEHTLRSYRTDLGKLCQHLCVNPLKATEGELVVFLQKEAERGLASSTISRRRTALRAFYDDANRQNKLFGPDPSRNLLPVKRPKRIPKYLQQWERDQLLEVLKAETPMDKRTVAIVALFYHAGLRTSEVNSLDLEDIGDHSLRVNGKGRKQREVPINSKLRDALNRWLAVHPGETGPLITSLGEQPGRLGACQTRAMVKRAFMQAGLGHRGYTPLSLRHTFATRHTDEGLPLHDLSRLLGHESLDTTRIYVHSRYSESTLRILDK